MSGALIIDKPCGPTSHDIVVRVRKATGIRRIGHTGTLDPMATGVLPLVIGRATRLAALLTTAEKTYDAEIRLGTATDTYDATGRVVERKGIAAQVDLAALEAALDAFRGTILQAPPPFSAKKVEGVRAYRLARRTVAVTPKAVRVTVHRLDVASFADDLVKVRLVCSAGFYVRSFAHDLGRRLGCGACVEALRRTRSGDFDIRDAVPLDVVEREGPGALRRALPMERLLLRLPAVTLTERGVRLAVHGNRISADDVRPPAPVELRQLADTRAAAPIKVRLLGPDEKLLAIAEARFGDELLHPIVVLG